MTKRKRPSNMQRRKPEMITLAKPVKVTSESSQKINQYRCQLCEGVITTVQYGKAVNGTTPMMTNCRVTDGCDGAMMSSMYRVPQVLEPDFEWYKPDKLPKDRATRQHVEMGGLLLRPIVTF